MRLLFRDVGLIDGIADAARQHVDVTVDGERIVAVERHEPTRAIEPGTTASTAPGGSWCPV